MECIRYISLANGMTFPTSTEQESFYAELIHADDNSAMENAALLAANALSVVTQIFLEEKFFPNKKKPYVSAFSQQSFPVE